MHHLDGVQAVAYARLRYMDTDYQRTERQRKVIELAFEKTKKADLKTLNDLLGNMLSMVATNLTWQDGLDMINDIKKYKLADTAGFPFEMDDMTLGTKGFIVVPVNLESNVLELHKYLFKDEDYEVSAKVKAYSDRISSDTGIYKDGNSVKRVKASGGYKSNSKSDEDDETKSKKKSTTEAETKKSVDIYIDIINGIKTVKLCGWKRMPTVSTTPTVQEINIVCSRMRVKMKVHPKKRNPQVLPKQV